jgi:hypothetical protein
MGFLKTKGMIQVMYCIGNWISISQIIIINIYRKYFTVETEVTDNMIVA